MVVRQRHRQETHLGLQWFIFGILLAILMASLMFFAIRVMAQQPSTPQAPNSQKMSSEERAMLIVRARELELTRLVAVYANRLDDVFDELQQLRQHIAATPACRDALTPPAPKEAPTP